VPIEQAEVLKRSNGFVTEELYLELEQDSVEVDLGYEGGVKSVDTYSLYEILEPRAQEVFRLLNDEINEYRLRTFMPSGIVLTGGGSLLSGISALASEIFGMNVRVGIPRGYSNGLEVATISDVLKSPIYATAYGLLVYSLKDRDRSLLTVGSGSAVKRIFKSMKSWIYDFL